MHATSRSLLLGWALLLLTIAAFLVALTPASTLAQSASPLPDDDDNDNNNDDNDDNNNNDDQDNNNDDNDNNDDQDNGNDDDDDGPRQRNIEIDIDSDKVEIEGRSSTDNSRVEFEMDLKSPGNSKTFEAEFEWKKGNSDNRDVKFVYKLAYAMEYQESGATEGYQADEDTVLSTYGGSGEVAGVPHSNARWTNWRQLPDQTLGTAVIKSFEATTEDNVLYVRGYISTEPARSGAVQLNPNRIKIDIGINNYSFVDDSANSHIALVARVQAETDVKRDNIPNRQVEIASILTSGVNAVLGWMPTVDVDGADVNVIATPLELEPSNSDDDDDNDSDDDEGAEYRIVYSFPRHGNVYLWDPTMGVSYQAGEADSAASAPVAAIQQLYNLLF